jgi:hypothetical protein
MQVVTLEQEKRALEQKVDRLDSTLSRLDSVLSKFIQEQQQKEQVVLIVNAKELRFPHFTLCKMNKLHPWNFHEGRAFSRAKLVQSRFIREIFNVPRFLCQI